jgi:hypothetical protein
MSHKILIARASDGSKVGMYLNGRLVMEGMDLRVEDVLGILAIEFETATVNPDWLRNRGGRLPDRPEAVDDNG